MHNPQEFLAFRVQVLEQYCQNQRSIYKRLQEEKENPQKLPEHEHQQVKGTCSLPLRFQCLALQKIQHVQIVPRLNKSTSVLNILEHVPIHQATTGFLIRPSFNALEIEYSSTPPTSPKRTIIFASGSFSNLNI